MEMAIDYGLFMVDRINEEINDKPTTEAALARTVSTALRMVAVSGITVFFFLAEDGIRPGTVTGVQTCALPISYAQWLCTGFTINCPESGETVMTDMREIGPTYYFAPPRIFENLLTQVMIRMEDASTLKRWLFRIFVDVARRVGPAILDGKPVGLW